jgi:deoxyribodipyrimidine photo-lyase
LSPKSPYAIHWFRRDLRAVGNPALLAAHGRFEGRVLGVFFLDRTILARPDFSPNRFAFYLRTLQALQESLRKAGGDLLVVDRPPRDGFRDLVSALRASALGAPAAVGWNRDYEPYARERDGAIGELLDAMGIETETGRDHLLFEPTELLKKATGSKDAGFYQVFGAFKRKWKELLDSPDGRDRIREARAHLEAPPPRFALRWPKRSDEFPFDGDSVLPELIERTAKETATLGMEPGPKPGFAAAYDAIETFGRSRLGEYPHARDLPAVPGTSRISPYLKNGSLTVPQVVAALGLEKDAERSKFLDELIWREFYVHLLYHRPDVEKQAFNPKFRDLQWENDPAKIERWKEGRTGFPIVDAGMRQLNRTGWMHNRVRMIVASFLVKDLLVDWRIGERYFMTKLLDGDLAPNNGGWQWAASTGCDPQPYFRIFNPVSQGARFDPEGEYVLQWIPELASRAGTRELHEPVDPVVDHGERRKLALDLFRRAAKGD